MLAAMFSGTFAMEADHDGYFIDRDGTHFGIILNYLRDGDCVFPKDDYVVRHLLKEAQFYAIEPLVQVLQEHLG